MSKKPYTMSEYVEEHVRTILKISEGDQIPEDIFDHVTEFQHSNDVIDGGVLTLEQIDTCINTMGKTSKDEETPAQKKARKLKLKKELGELGDEEETPEPKGKGK